VYEHMSLKAGGAEAQGRGGALEEWRKAFPEMASDWDLAWAGRLRDGWRESLPGFAAGEQIATARPVRRRWRPSTSSPRRWRRGGRSGESTKTVFPGAGEFSRVHSGRNIPFGIREHAMGAIVNGAAAHGGVVKP